MSQPKETLAQKLIAKRKSDEECARIILNEAKPGGIMEQWARKILGLAHAEESKKDATGERGR